MHACTPWHTHTHTHTHMRAHTCRYTPASVKPQTPTHVHQHVSSLLLLSLSMMCFCLLQTNKVSRSTKPSESTVPFEHLSRQLELWTSSSFLMLLIEAQMQPLKLFYSFVHIILSDIETKTKEYASKWACFKTSRQRWENGCFIEKRVALSGAWGFNSLRKFSETDFLRLLKPHAPERATRFSIKQPFSHLCLDVLLRTSLFLSQTSKRASNYSIGHEKKSHKPSLRCVKTGYYRCINNFFCRPIPYTNTTSLPLHIARGWWPGTSSSAKIFFFDSFCFLEWTWPFWNPWKTFPKANVWFKQRKTRRKVVPSLTMTSQASLPLSLLLTKVTHAQYRKRFRASYIKYVNSLSLSKLEQNLKIWKMKILPLPDRVKMTPSFIDSFIHSFI